MSLELPLRRRVTARRILDPDHHRYGGSYVRDGRRWFECLAEHGEVLGLLMLQESQAPLRAEIPLPSKREVVLQKDHQEPMPPVIPLWITLLGAGRRAGVGGCRVPSWAR